MCFTFNNYRQYNMLTLYTESYIYHHKHTCSLLFIYCMLYISPGNDMPLNDTSNIESNNTCVLPSVIIDRLIY